MSDTVCVRESPLDVIETKRYGNIFHYVTGMNHIYRTKDTTSKKNYTLFQVFTPMLVPILLCTLKVSPTHKRTLPHPPIHPPTHTLTSSCGRDFYRHTPPIITHFTLETHPSQQLSDISRRLTDSNITVDEAHRNHLLTIL